jgi:hypothetical protein
MSLCPTCGEWQHSYHKCNPQWECWEAEGGDRGCSHDVRGYDAEAAAETYAEDCDADERDLLKGGTMTVHVVPKGAPADAVPKVFEITAEAVVNYSAHEVTP